MSKPKGGLQKKVSSIFDGVPLDSEAVRGDIRRPEKPVVPASSLPSAPPRPMPPVTPPVAPVAPMAPSVSVPPVAPVQAPKPTVFPPAPSAWPKAPTVQPESPKPQVEQKPKISLAAAMSAEAPAVSPVVPRTPATRPETPARPQAAVSERPATPRVMPKVIVKKKAGPAEKYKTAMLLGGLALLFVIAVAYSMGLFSGKPAAVTPPSLSSEQTIPTMTRIQWQRPTAPPAVRNPMRVSSNPTNPQNSTVSAASGEPRGAFNVSATATIKGVQTAIIDGQYVKVGDTVNDARVITIAANYVELERDGKTIKSFVNTRGIDTGSTDVTPDAESQSIK